MAKFWIDMTVDFSGEIEADNAADAEQKAWTSWGGEAGALISFYGVNDITVTEVEEEEDN